VRPCALIFSELPTGFEGFLFVANIQTDPKPAVDTALKLEGVWRVVVLNDPVNLMSYVVLVFKKVFGALPR
jgi:ATP-dependent Clp protease adapter protein ClpS